MKIFDFSEFIKLFPTELNSFRIKRSNWIVSSKIDYINAIFDNKDFVNITRNDIRNEAKNLDFFIIKILMWGYPTKGRGNNIENILEFENFEKLRTLLLKYKNAKNISFETLIYDFKNEKIKGLGISTLSKFLYFLEIKINNLECVILDDKLIDIINVSNFDEIKELKGISREYCLKNSINKVNYLNYLEAINTISKSINVKSEKLEMFLFFFGKNL